MASIVNTKGVDISYANGNIDLAKVKAAGYSWVMIRCGYGSDMTSQDDTQFASNVSKAEKLGMPWGVYHFSYACSTADAKSELAHIDRLLKAQAAKGYYPTLPVALDMEYTDYVKNNGGWNSSNLTNVATIILDGLKNLGYYPMIYTGYSELAMLSDHIRNDYDCWFAQWNSKPDAYKYNRMGMWQYGGETNYLESNSISGVGTIDKNYVYKDYPTIIKNGGYNGFKKNSASANTTTNTAASSNAITASKILNIAKAEIGTKATAVKKCKYNTWYYGSEVSGSAYDWCEVFVQWVFHQAGASSLLYTKTANCGYAAKAFQDKGKLIVPSKISDIKVGDVVFFNWSGEKSTLVPGTRVSDHVGIVESVNTNDSTITSIEGNTGSTSYGEVLRQVRSLSKISCVGRPSYGGSSSSSGSSSSPSSSSAPDVIYKVRTGGRWLPEVKNLELSDGDDFAGIKGKAITDVAIKVSKGSVKYRAHVKGGGWLSWITKYDTSDTMGYAGIGSPIDALEVYYYTPSDIANSQGYYKAKYRVSPVNSGYYDWQYDTETTGGQDGYAGSFGKSFDRLQICLAK